MTVDQRSRGIAIAKALAIIGMVIGHAEGPGPLISFIFTWHMPLFFIAAGYFFSDRAVDEPFDFIGKRFRKLYVPFVKWSLLFLVLHNLWFEVGVLNEQYGNWTGGVTHPYTLRVALQRAVAILTSMSGYDEFMAGAFWFFRGLLVSSVVFLVLYRLLRRHTRLTASQSAFLICMACVAFAALRLAFNIKLSYYPNGGFRETWGVFFFGAGVILRRNEHRLLADWWFIAVGLGLMMVAGHFKLRGMNNGIVYRDLWSLPLTGIIGFLTVFALSRRIAAGVLGGALEYVGRNTMPVYVFHILAYKLVSLAKIAWYGLDPGQIGCHMVIHYRHDDDFFWVMYTMVGVGLPLLVNYCVGRLRLSMPSLRRAVG